jgi:FkbM family methyltransferase
MQELLPFVNSSVGGTVIEIGSRDGHDANAMSYLFGARRTVIIEANPECFWDIVRDYPYYEAYNVAITNESGPVEFYAMHYENPAPALGQSSLLYRELYDTLASKIVVPGYTMDHFTERANINSIEAIKIDVEGATYQALQGFTKIRMTRLLHIESEHKEVWPGQKLYADTVDFMKDAGYEQVYFKHVFESQSDTIWQRID